MQENFVDALIFLVMTMCVGCFAAERGLIRNGEVMIFYSQEGKPVQMRAYVPYDGAPPESTSYMPVTP